MVGDAEPVIVDGPSELAADVVPTYDAEVPVGTYRDWSEADTRVIVCAIGNDVYPGRRFATRDAAVKAITAEHGRILEANYVPGRAFLRVKRG